MFLKKTGNSDWYKPGSVNVVINRTCSHRINWHCSVYMCNFFYPSVVLTCTLETNLCTTRNFHNRTLNKTHRHTHTPKKTKH